MLEDPQLTPMIRRVGIFSWSLVGAFAVIGGLGWLVIKAEIVIIPVVFALVLVYILNPVVRTLHKWRIPRVIGTLVSYVLFFGLLWVAFEVLAPFLGDQFSSFGDQIPNIYATILETVAGWLSRLGVVVTFPTWDSIFGSFLADTGLQGQVASVAELILSIARGLVETVTLFLIAPVIAFYFLIDLPRASAAAVELLPPAHRDELHYVGQRLTKALGGFVRGQVVAASVVVLFSAIGYRLVGLELWLVVALIAGVLNFIPFVGPGLTGLIAFGLALVQGEIRIVIGIMVVATIVQQLDNHIVSPLVLRATVKLHPSLIILSLLVGGSLGGFLGLLVAVPLLAVTKVFISHFWKTRVLGEPWREAAETIVEEQQAHPTTEILVEKIRARLDRETDGNGGPADPVEVTTE